MKDLLLLSIVGVFTLENGMVSDSEVTAVWMDMTDDLKTSGLVDLEVSDNTEYLESLKVRLILSLLNDDLDAKMYHVHKDLKHKKRRNEVIEYYIG
ncbi:Protein CBG10301 [Caenorhabditis briggsae]|uniref:Protein CBG10301 n=1 Tax=Caenorhabditis briggsae TaxID=6238 RepID=A8XAN4_CAEBR|nr:Protein CBG10301 [Caenorhabditis briggsae]CAP29699.1 Protein CBG10301 [Caenorhabditis briggsae]